MRIVVCFFIVIALSGTALSQTNKTDKMNVASERKNERWNLEKYVWSYTHNANRKTDKAKLDFDAIDNWQVFGDYLAISNDGKYFSYTIEKGSWFTDNRKVDSLVVQSIDDSWHKSFAGASPGCFSGDNKEYIYQNNDTIYLVQLGTEKYKFISNVESYKIPEGRNDWIAYKLKNKNTVVIENLVTGNKKEVTGVVSYSFDNSNQWFSCQLDNSQKELLIYNLDARKDQKFSGAKSYRFSPGGEVLLIDCGNKLKYFNNKEQTIATIWTTRDTSESLSSFECDGSGTQAVFAVKDMSNAKPVNSIWYYKQGMDKAFMKVNKGTAGVTGDFNIQEAASFSDNNRYIHFTFERTKEVLPANDDVVQLSVWSHKDLNLQSEQQDLSKQKQTKVYNAFINLESGNSVILENGEDENLSLFQSDFAIIRKKTEDSRWKKGYWSDSNWVVSLKDGSRHLFPVGVDMFWFSPGGNFLVFFDSSKGHYFSYSLSSGKVVDISANIRAGQLGIKVDYEESPEYPYSLAAWIGNDSSVLVYDKNDLWKLDLTGRKPARNITNDFGRSHNICFSLMNSDRGGGNVPILREKESLLLRSFNNENKYNGYYCKEMSGNGDPELLTMGPYFTQMPHSDGHKVMDIPNDIERPRPPVKARDTDIWVVQRQSGKEAPNYYEVTNFKNCKRLTDLEPQKKYNWLSEELYHFKHLDGGTGQGILYKPENFDPTKKYPVLIVFYTRYSNWLWQFPKPAYNYCAIAPGLSPNWFLDNGYLIFTPDMEVAPLKYGPAAFNVIEGAVRYLKQLNYVDTGKIGCCAHSWSAKLGAYIFTHSKDIAAFGISEGMLYGNMISEALSTSDRGESRLEEVENGFQMGNLYEHKNLWLDQTTVLNVDKANSPLLLLCNERSIKEYQNQTLQLFTALRRLEKEVWWLKYDKGDHTLSDLNEQKDYTIRYTQFFDHYLKGAPAPSWMTQGIPYGLKGVENRYELDPAGSCGKDCKICKKWNERYRLHPEVFMKPVSEWNF